MLFLALFHILMYAIEKADDMGWKKFLERIFTLKI